MPGVGDVGRARAALYASQRRPAPARRVGAHPRDPLPLRRLPLAAPPRERPVSLARSSRRPVHHPARNSPTLIRVPARLVAVAPPDRPSAELPSRHPGVVSGRYVTVLVRTLTGGMSAVERTSADRPTRSPSAHSVAVWAHVPTRGPKPNCSTTPRYVTQPYGIAGRRRAGDLMRSHSRLAQTL
jgi:hypothetical protein